MGQKPQHKPDSLNLIEENRRENGNNFKLIDDLDIVHIYSIYSIYCIIYIYINQIEYLSKLSNNRDRKFQQDISQCPNRID